MKYDKDTYVRGFLDLYEALSAVLGENWDSENRVIRDARATREHHRDHYEAVLRDLQQWAEQEHKRFNREGRS